MFEPKSEILKFYEQVIKDTDHINLKVNELRTYASNALAFWREYENPTYSITEVYPKSKEGASTQKPYYRAQASFTNNGKKERISCYIGPIDEFKNGKSDFKLINIAVTKLKEQMMDKCQIPSKNEVLENRQDRYMRNTYRIYQLIRNYIYPQERIRQRDRNLNEGLFKDE